MLEKEFSKKRHDGLVVDDVACHHLYPRSKVPNGDSMYYDNLMNLCISTRVAALALDD